MKRMVWVGLIALGGVALFRLGEFVGLCWIQMNSPLEVQFLESKFVHLCWRFQAGLALYRDWRQYPYVPNFFGPVYPVIVGGLGRLLGADLDRLTWLARLVSFAAAILGALIAGGWTARRYGWVAGGIAGLVAVGSLPTLAFSAMARPDVLSDTLGLAGLILAGAGGGGNWRRMAGILLLAAAAMTKQTAALYGLAAVVSLAGQRQLKAAGWVGFGLAGLVAGLVGIATATFSPHLASSLLAERLMPYDDIAARSLFLRTVSTAPDLVVFLALGLFAWARPGTRDPVGLSLAVVAVPLMLGASVKLGSDYNYYLPIRVAAALGAGAWCGWAVRAVEKEGWVRSVAGVGTIVAALGMVPGVLNLHHLLVAHAERERALKGPEGVVYLEALRQLYEVAADPETRVLTDIGPVALRQGDRASFVDPWLFRNLVNHRLIRPVGMVGMIRRGEFDLIITRGMITSEEYLDDQFAMPQAFTLAARNRYVELPTNGLVGHLHVPAEQAEGALP